MLHAIHASWFIVFTAFFTTILGNENRSSVFETNCSALLMGQYLCPSPDIDPLTQEPKGCGPNNIANGIQFSLSYIVQKLNWKTVI